MGQKQPPCPTEEVEQIQLMDWVERVGTAQYPELAMLHHIPNGGKRGKGEAGRFRAMGTKSGVPDLCLPVPRGPYHGLYIELKRLRGGTLRPDQHQWLDALTAQGYVACMCRGQEAAKKALLWYLSLPADEVQPNWTEATIYDPDPGRYTAGTAPVPAPATPPDHQDPARTSAGRRHTRSCPGPAAGAAHDNREGGGRP